MIINGEEYQYLLTRSYTPVEVYKGKDSFLRIGPKQFIAVEVGNHRRFEKFHFPVAPILAEGTDGERQYFVEQSLGNVHYGDVFALDVMKREQISDEHFRAWVDLTMRFNVAQMNTARTMEASDWPTFSHMLHADEIRSEMPQVRESIDAVLEIVQKKLTGTQWVLSHNDCNPHNMFPGGIIDFERVTYAPCGYDLVTNLAHTYLHPVGKQYEFARKYAFSENQILAYRNTFPALGACMDELLICRAIWSTARMHRWPKTQKWRYKTLERLLFGYLMGKSSDFLLR